LGDATLTVMLPGVVAPIAAAEADLDAKIAAYADFRPVVALPMLAQLEIAESIVVGFQSCIALGIEPPSLSVQIDLVASALLAVRAELLLIQNLLALLSAGVHAYAYDGTAAGFGPEVTAALTAGLPGGAGPTEHVNALVLATNLAASWSAMSAVFKVTP
jgi:hypothetical protein